MKNQAKINLVISECRKCPFAREVREKSYCCAHGDMDGMHVGDGTSVPDYCPFVLLRLNTIINSIKEMPDTQIPKIYLKRIKRKQEQMDLEKAVAKYASDHAFSHVERVTRYGIQFLHDCRDAGFSSPDTIQKEILLFRLAAYMHDIGLAESIQNHAVHSSELAKKYLSRQDIDEADMMTIVRAIANHSDGRETNTIIDAALLLADKLDVTKDRLVHDVPDEVIQLFSHVNNVSFSFEYKKGKAIGAVLQYETDGVDGEKFAEVYPKCILVPKMITQKFLKLSSFTFVVDGVKIDVDKIKY